MMISVVTQKGCRVILVTCDRHSSCLSVKPAMHPPNTTQSPQAGTMSVDAPKLQSIKLPTTKGQPSTKSTKSQPLQTKSAPSQPVAKPVPQKNVSRRSSKPIINWFQRKLAGTGKKKRAGNVNPNVDLGLGKPRGVTNLSRTAPRIASSPVPIPRPQGRVDLPRRKTVSLNGDDDSRNTAEDLDDNSMDRSSLAHESTWSPASVLEADDDASLRPLPPSAPPSPSPSRSSSSYLSDPRTFRSIAASTKPTTLLSIDMNGNGMAHIAEAPVTPLHGNRLYPHVRTSSSATNPTVASITFSQFPQSSLAQASSPSLQSSPAFAFQAPQHTSHHPRNNPRPSSPPLDNASVLTLASSAYAVPGLRPGIGHSAATSARGLGDSLSHFGGSLTFPDAESTSQFVVGDEDRHEERDVAASVRALRPRSSRRGSWESEASRWSARDQLGTGTPSLARDRSLWTTNSVRTGGLSIENTETYDRSDDAVGTDDMTGEDLSEPRQSPASNSGPPACTNDSELPPGVTPDPPPGIGCRCSTDTVAEPVPDFDGSVKAEVLAPTDTQVNIKKDHPSHPEKGNSCSASAVSSKEH
jgi:hypothetical protein